MAKSNEQFGQEPIMGEHSAFSLYCRRLFVVAKEEKQKSPYGHLINQVLNIGVY
jgi:hypothetical protein